MEKKGGWREGDGVNGKEGERWRGCWNSAHRAVTDSYLWQTGAALTCTGKPTSQYSCLYFDSLLLSTADRILAMCFTVQLAAFL
jgi:hypothetical protein